MVATTALPDPGSAPGTDLHPAARGRRRARHGAAEPRRVLGRQPSLPAGRAIVGGLLVTVAAIGTFAAYANAAAGPTRSFLVAAHPLRAGQRLASADVRAVPMELPDAVAGEAFTSAAELDGATVLAPLDADQLIAPAAVRRADEQEPAAGSRELSFAIDRDKALDGHLQRGELVDLVATYGNGVDAYTSVVARRAQVVAVDTGKGTVGSSGRVTITITVESDRRVLEAAHAIEVAEIRLVRTRGDTGDGGDAAADPAVDRYRPEAALDEEPTP